MSVKKRRKRNKKKSEVNIEQQIKEIIIEETQKKETKTSTKKVKEKKPKVEEVKESVSKEQIEDINELPITSKKKSYIKLILIILLVIGLISLLIYTIIPKIYLKGQENITISYKDTYKEPGYTAKSLYKNYTKKVKVKTNVKQNKVGIYKTTYTLKKYGITFKKTRTITIVDKEPPVINIESDEFNVCPNQDKPILNYTVIDEYDGDLTDSTKETITEDKVTLEATDSSNNKVKKEIKLTYGDTISPTLTLNGNETIYVTFGRRYNEQGYIATDNCMVDAQSKVKVSGSVGRSPSTYTLTYEITDDAGNKTTKTRKVVVESKPVSDAVGGNIYLTFDDGPNAGTTNKILDILKEENVKATFFVTGKGPDYLIQRIVNEGHTIALHTNTHQYSYIYSSTDNYFADLYAISTRVKNLTGVDTKIIRFPGGTSNTVSRSYKKGIMKELSSMVLNQGYRYYDWNISSGDAGGARNSNDVFYNVTTNLSHSKTNMVLMHDTKAMTRDALKDIIKYGKLNNYNFQKIDMNTPVIRHGVNN